MLERHQFKRKKQQPIVEEARRQHDSKYRKKLITVWCFDSWFWRIPPKWRVYKRYSTMKAAEEAVKTAIYKYHWLGDAFFWIGDRPPEN